MVRLWLVEALCKSGGRSSHVLLYGFAIGIINTKFRRKRLKHKSRNISILDIINMKNCLFMKNFVLARSAQQAIWELGRGANKGI